MKILTNENKTLDLLSVYESNSEYYYGILDFSNKNNVDYFFIPLVFLENFYSPSIEILLRGTTIQLPLDWFVLIGDENVSSCEFISLKSINDRNFKFFTFNPVSGYMYNLEKIEICNIFYNKKWIFPKLKQNTALAYPIFDTDDSPCIFITPECSKQNQVVDFHQLF
ncbi:MAG: hypothetical protein NZZ41_00160 [Candidatus Dojkabacteria bacterium]|nr:hypothetical protein [Candidatus Dojkabacteria bacterium]